MADNLDPAAVERARAAVDEYTLAHNQGVLGTPERDGIVHAALTAALPHIAAAVLREARREAAPTVSAEHTVTAEWDSGYSPTLTFRCNAGPQSLCHAVYDCLCEEWVRDEVEDGRPWHEPFDGEGERHYGTFRPEVCGLSYWFENTDDALDGEVTFGVTEDYQGGFYLFHPTTPPPSARCSFCDEPRDDLSTGGGMATCQDCAAEGEVTP